MAEPVADKWKKTNSNSDEKIVIVDDTPLLASAIAEVLSYAGYLKTKAFEDPRAALAYSLEGPSPAVIITDFTMPEMDGVELLAEVERHHPEVKGIIISAAPKTVKKKTQRFNVINKETGFYEDLVDCVGALLEGPAKDKS